LSRFLYPEAVLDLMEATQCTGIAGVPSIYQTLLRNTSFPRRKIKSLRKVQQAGGKLPTVLIQELIDAVGQENVYVMYGQTEATARLSYLPPQLLDTKLGSVGQGIPGVTLKVLAESGAAVKPGDVGEIVAWGDNISPGYLNDPEATAEKFRDGALFTRDLAMVDEDGFIYVVDRAADFIKSYGHRVSSQVVEACVLELPEIVAAAAVGVPDLARGEAIVVYVTLSNDSTLTPEDVIAYCKQHMAQYMVPRNVQVLKSLPLNVNGKVLKSVLRQKAADEMAQPA
ncbi:MAG: AMP-binding protein, partial [Chloroflexota bacterium]